MWYLLAIVEIEKKDLSLFFFVVFVLFVFSFTSRFSFRLRNDLIKAERETRKPEKPRQQLLMHVAKLAVNPNTSNPMQNRS